MRHSSWLLSPQYPSIGRLHCTSAPSQSDTPRLDPTSTFTCPERSRIIGPRSKPLIPGAAAATEHRSCLKKNITSTNVNMAPTAADTAPSAQRQARRPLSRIVPAIPHRLSRSRNIPSSRPLSPPEEPNSGTVSKHEPEPQPVVEQLPKEQLPVPSNAEAPLTPESRISNGDTSEVEAPGLATSPAKSVDDHVEIAGEPTGMSGFVQPLYHRLHMMLTWYCQISTIRATPTGALLWLPLKTSQRSLLPTVSLAS
jgi:hypothetical protein